MLTPSAQGVWTWLILRTTTMAVRAPQPLGALLRQYRLARGLTQEELAERAQISERSVSDLERGLARRPHRDTMRRLADALDLSPEERAWFEAEARGVRVLHPLGAVPDAAAVTNLPDEMNSFVGRALELETICALLQRPDVRLLTLLGTGGTGKTRLAARAGRQLLPQYPDGVHFVSLAALADPRDVVPAIASTLGVLEASRQAPVETVRRFLHGKRLLLILDNFEHVLEAASDVRGLLEGNADVRLLITSRAPLHLYGEHEYPVHPLSLPDLGHLPPPDALPRHGAVALFLDRVRAVDPDFEITEENAAAVAEICVRLDGLPLAIELAAARLRIFTPQALLDRLQTRLSLLTGGPRDVPARQQTLRDAVDWSYRLLAPGEQTLLSRLAVFADGCTLEAVEAICATEGELDLLAGMTSLVQQSLVDRSGSSDPRFRMLETVREYAAERLEASGEDERVRRAHAGYCMELVCRLESDEARQPLPEVIDWLRCLVPENDNLRAALRWLLTTGEAEQALHLVGRLGQYWMLQGLLSEGRRWTEEALALRGGETSPLHAQALYSLHRFLREEGAFIEADQVLRCCLALYESLGDRRGMARALYSLGNVAAELGHPETDFALQQQALSLFREVEDEPWMAQAMICHCMYIHHAGEPERAQAMADEALTILRSYGPTLRLARALLDEGSIFLTIGSYEQALPLLQEAFSYYRQLGRSPEYPICLELLAQCLAFLRHPERACRLFGATAAMRASSGAAPHDDDAQIRERAIRAARAGLDEAAWQRLWDEGRSMTLEQTVAYVLAEVLGR